MFKLIQQRFSTSEKEFVVFPQVPSASGFVAKSYIDALVVGLWEAHGRIRMAMEIKVRRSDFLQEIKNPEKNLPWRDGSLAHEFYYVTPRGVIESPDGVPEGCGWYQTNPKGDGLIRRKKAFHHDSVTTPDGFFETLCLAFIRAEEKDREEYRRSFREADPEVQRLMNMEQSMKDILVSRDGRG